MQLNDYSIKEFTTQNGETIDINLVYAKHGELSATRDNAILVVTSYSATHEDAEALFARSDVLDLSGHCVIVVNMLTNSLSSSPSNTPPPSDDPRERAPLLAK